MTRFWLVRHGAYGMIDHGLGGREPHGLDVKGEAQAALLARRFEGCAVAAVIASPVRRAVETAAPVARALGLELGIEPGLAEIAFGAWTGRSFAALDDEPAWRAWNAFRSTAPTADGETMLAVQARAVAALGQLAAKYGDTDIVAVSHGDVIKAMLVHFLGAPLDLMHRIEIEPASISRIALHERDARVLGINQPP